MRHRRDRGATEPIGQAAPARRGAVGNPVVPLPVDGPGDVELVCALEAAGEGLPALRVVGGFGQ